MASFNFWFMVKTVLNSFLSKFTQFYPNAHCTDLKTKVSVFQQREQTIIQFLAIFFKTSFRDLGKKNLP